MNEVLAGLFAALVSATMIGYVLGRRQPLSDAIRNLNDRIRVWWILMVIGCAALVLGRNAIIALFAVASLLALAEYLGWSFVAVLAVLQYAWIAAGWAGLFYWWIPLCCVFLTRRAGNGLLLTVYGLSHVPALLLLPGGSPLLAAFLVIVAQVSDVMQYVFGKLWGRHLLAPKLSPSKTVEGLAGGLISATLLGSLLSPITPFTHWEAGVMALFIGIFGFLGGLLMSAIKRRRGVKDWGSLLQGHGGILDRVDSLCLSAPVFFYLIRYH